MLRATRLRPASPLLNFAMLCPAQPLLRPALHGLAVAALSDAAHCFAFAQLSYTRQRPGIALPGLAFAERRATIPGYAAASIS